MGCSMEVVPRNPSERFYAFFLAVFGVFVFYPMLAVIVVGMGKMCFFPGDDVCKRGPLAVRIGVLSVVLLISFVAIACIFLAVGSSEQGWVQRHTTDANGFYVFLTTLHWAISQFPHTSMEVVPSTVSGRFVAVLV